MKVIILFFSCSLLTFHSISQVPNLRSTLYIINDTIAYLETIDTTDQFLVSYVPGKIYFIGDNLSFKEQDFKELIFEIALPTDSVTVPYSDSINLELKVKHFKDERYFTHETKFTLDNKPLVTQYESKERQLKVYTQISGKDLPGILNISTPDYYIKGLILPSDLANSAICCRRICSIDTFYENGISLPPLIERFPKRFLFKGKLYNVIIEN